MMRVMVFLMGATAALTVSAAPAREQKSSDAELARQIREDQSLQQVHQIERDVVRAYVGSFKAQGLKTCLYFSILDLRADIRPYCATREKINLVKDRLTEMLSNYGEITALVVDGRNAAWSRFSHHEMPFLEIYEHVKRLQPNCLMSDYNQGSFPAPALYFTYVKQYEQRAGQTIPTGSRVPSQSATTLQSEWFWKLDYPQQELRSARQVVEEWLIPFNTHHCNPILNVAPNREGRFDQNAVDRLAEIGQLWRDRVPAPSLSATRQILTPNFASGRPPYASSIADTSGPDLANDDKPATYWWCGDGKTSGWVEIDLQEPHSHQDDCPHRADLSDRSRARQPHRLISCRSMEQWEVARGTRWRVTYGAGIPGEPDLCSPRAPQPKRIRQATRDRRLRALCGARARSLVSAQSNLPQSAHCSTTKPIPRDHSIHLPRSN